MRKARKANWNASSTSVKTPSLRYVQYSKVPSLHLPGGIILMVGSGCMFIHTFWTVGKARSVLCIVSQIVPWPLPTLGRYFSSILLNFGILLPNGQGFSFNNNNNNNSRTLFLVTQSHCVSLPSSQDECRTSPDSCWPLDQFDGLEPVPCGLEPTCRHLWNYIHHRHLLLLSPDTHFTMPQMVEGWVDLNGLPAHKQWPIQVVTRHSVD